LVVDQAREMLLERSPDAGILLAWSPEWHRGVVGIAAGRLAREFHRPTVLLAQDGNLATGSGRSVPGIGLHGFLERFADRYERFGGHDAAIGMTVLADRLESLREEWEQAADWPEELLQPRYEHEIDLRPGEVTPELFRRLARLEPHGENNAKPMVRLTPLQIPGGPVEFGEQHVKARAIDAEGGSGALWMVGWRWRDRAAELAGEIEAIGYLNWDSFLNWPSLTLTDVRPLTR
jgi:single-stranded-DNA-specific exonuclease